MENRPKIRTGRAGKKGNRSGAHIRHRETHTRAPMPEVSEGMPVVCTGIKKNIETNLASYSLSFTTHDGVASHDVQGGIFVSPNKLFSCLADLGYNGDRGAVSKLAKEGAQRKYQVCKVSAKGGWIGSQLLTRFGTFGVRGETSQCMFDPEHEQFKKACYHGSKEEFLERAGELMSASPEICFAYLAALAAPAGSLIGKSSFSVCFSSESTTGKTSVIAFAQSLATYAVSDEDLINFGDTLGSLLDDLDVFGGVVAGFADIKNAVEKDRDLANKLQTLTFSNSSGHKRRRLGDRQPKSISVSMNRRTFNLFLLSAERPLSQLFRDAGVRREGGDIARLVEIPIPNRVQGGIFANVAAEKRDGFAERFSALRRTQYGMILPVWCNYLASTGQAIIAKSVEVSEHAFSRRVGELEPLHGRIGKHFAFLDAIAVIAERAGLLPIPIEKMHSALDLVFDRIAKFNKARHLEELQYQVARLEEMTGSFYPLTQVGNPPADLARAKMCFRREEVIGGKRVTVINLHRESFLANAEEPERDFAGNLIKLIRNEMPLLKDGVANPVKQEGLDRRRYIRFTRASAIQLENKLKAKLKETRLA